MKLDFYLNPSAEVIQRIWGISRTPPLRQGYHHLPLSQDARAKTAFVTPLGHYQYKVLPYGLKVAPRLFQFAMETVLHHHLNKRCVVYLDDICVFGSTFPILLENLHEIFKTLSQAGVSLNLTKCEFLATTIEYLGHIVGKSTLHPTPRHCKAVREFPRPSTVRQLRRFLGMASYLHKFVPGHHVRERQLRALILKDSTSATSLKWTPETEATFNMVRTAIAEDAELTRFDPTAVTELHVDASATGLGATLFQYQNGKFRAIEYAGRQLDATEQKYTNTERELLAAVWAVTHKFRIYLEGIAFTICTDHKALLGQIRLKETTRRIIHLLMKLEPYNFTFRHVGGADMAVPDALSRSYADVVRANPALPVPAAVVQALNLPFATPVDIQSIDEDQRQLITEA